MNKLIFENLITKIHLSEKFPYEWGYCELPEKMIHNFSLPTSWFFNYAFQCGE